MRSFFLLILSVPLLVFGQTNADSIRFEIIKRTVNFLAKDSKISKDVKFSVSCSSAKNFKAKYTCLEASIDDSKLKGVLQKVRIWDAKKTGNKPADLKQLKGKILQDIFTPSAKSYRKKITGYGNYIESIDLLINGYKVNSFNTKPKPQINHRRATPNAADSAGIDTAVTSSPVDDPVVKKDAPKQPAPDTTTKNVSSIKTHTMEETIIPLIALVISILALLKKGKPPEKTDKTINQSPETDGLKSKIKSLTESVEQLKTKSAKDLEFMRQSLENRITELENNKNTFELPLTPQLKPTTRPAEDVADTSAILPSTIYKYAKFSDMDGGGFSAGILSDTQNGEQTYEILILGDQAEYGVSDDARAQKYALHNYEYLADACDIKGQPQTNSRIDTVAKGQLIRTPTGGWSIETKAAIELK